jgi:hypothetical protein
MGVENLLIVSNLNRCLHFIIFSRKEDVTKNRAMVNLYVSHHEKNVHVDGFPFDFYIKFVTISYTYIFPNSVIKFMWNTKKKQKKKNQKKKNNKNNKNS